VIKLDPVEKKVGLSIKAALDEPDSDTVKQYFDSQPGDGSATLGDVMDPALLRSAESAQEASEAEAKPEEGTAAEEAKPEDEEPEKPENPS
jgi:hypothetical protein